MAHHRPHSLKFMEVLMVDFADMSSRTRICKDMMNVCIRDEIKHPVSCDRIREFDSEGEWIRTFQLIPKLCIYYFQRYRPV